MNANYFNDRRRQAYYGSGGFAGLGGKPLIETAMGHLGAQRVAPSLPTGYRDSAMRGTRRMGFTSGPGFGALVAYNDTQTLPGYWSDIRASRRFGFGDTVAVTDDGDSVAASAVSPNTNSAVVSATSPGGVTATTAPAVSPPDRIRRHIGNATGGKGFLLWAEAAMPPEIAQAVLAAAMSMSANYQAQGGQLGVFGDGGDDDGSDLTGVSDITITDPTTAASNAPVTAAWSSNMANVIANATSTLMNASDASLVNQAASANLQRAQAGEAPLATDVSGLETSAVASNTGMLVGVGLLGLVLLAVFMGNK